MSTRHLIVGLDGLDLQVVVDLGPEVLPTLHRLMQQGSFAASQSVCPPATLPNWATFLTGTDPGQHGVFDFTTRDGYAVKFTAGTVRQEPTLFARLDRLGLQCACLHFPGTWPPEKLEHGAFISGWDAPVAFEADRSFVWPPDLHGRIEKQFGPIRFDDVDEFHANSDGWVDQLPNALTQRIERKTEFGSWLVNDRDWDVFAIYFGESDTASHYLWPFYDECSPRRPSHTKSATKKSGLAQVYRALDTSLQRLLSAAGHQDVELTIISDHGSGGSSDKVLYLNRALADAGLLKFRQHRGVSAVRKAKDMALTFLPPALREKIFSFGNRSLPNFVESQARFGHIDMPSTIAFSDELNYFPAVHLNLAGREKDGTVERAHKEAALALVTRALLQLRDPWSDQQVVKAVHRRESIYHGPYVDRAPDLLLDLALDHGYSYNLMPSGNAPQLTGSWRKLSEHEFLGKKGRSLPGSHRKKGFGLIHGPSVKPVGEIDAHIADFSATLLSRIGASVGNRGMGRVLSEALVAKGSIDAELPDFPMPKNQSVGDEKIVEQRLRALGYID